MKRSKLLLMSAFLLVLSACEGVKEPIVGTDPSSEQPIVVKVDRDGSVFVEGEEIALSELRGHIEQTPGTSVQIVVHQDTPSEALVQVMKSIDSARMVDGSNVGIAMQPETD